MNKYFAHFKSKTTHERRTHAMQVAGGVTALALVVWASTLGVRFASTTPPQVATNDTAQMASVVESQTGNATLIVATTSASSNAEQTRSYFGQ